MEWLLLIFFLRLGLSESFRKLSTLVFYNVLEHLNLEHLRCLHVDKADAIPVLDKHKGVGEHVKIPVGGHESQQVRRIRRFQVQLL